MCLLGLIHATLVVATYHAGGDTNPILNIFNGSPLTNSIVGVPFQPFGFFALVILVLMAATSHDFWLANLSAPVWKSLHMLVYIAYGLLAKQRPAGHRLAGSARCRVSARARSRAERSACRCATHDRRKRI